MSRPILFAMRHNGHQPPRTGQSEQDVDGEERVLTKSVMASELIVRESADHPQTRRGAVISCLSGHKY